KGSERPGGGGVRRRAQRQGSERAGGRTTGSWLLPGPESFRQEIRKGNLALPLERIRQAAQSPDGCSEFERVLLKDLELTQKYMQRVMGKSQDQRLSSRPFHAQCHLLSGGILSRARAFFHTLRQLHDRCGHAYGPFPVAPCGDV